MKGLQFLGNRVEDAANAFIDVLKYSDQSVEYPDFKDIEPWPDEIVNMFYVIWENAKFSELNAIDNDLSVYAECSCGNSFYIETEDEQDNYSEW